MLNVAHYSVNKITEIAGFGPLGEKYASHPFTPILAISRKSSTFPASISKIAPAPAKFLQESRIPAFSVAHSFARETLGPPPGLLCPLYGSRRHVPAFWRI
jgi:hypothetical protein